MGGTAAAWLRRGAGVVPSRAKPDAAETSASCSGPGSSVAPPNPALPRRARWDARTQPAALDTQRESARRADGGWLGGPRRVARLCC
jgi:hypothetical protein